MEVDIISPSTGKSQPAADAEHLPRYVVGARACEKQDRIRDLLRLGKASEWNSAQESFLQLFGSRLQHRRIGGSGADAIDVDRMARDFAGKGLGECNHPAFGGGISGLTRAPHAAGIARYIDDLS